MSSIRDFAKGENEIHIIYIVIGLIFQVKINFRSYSIALCVRHYVISKQYLQYLLMLRYSVINVTLWVCDSFKEPKDLKKDSSINRSKINCFFFN